MSDKAHDYHSKLAYYLSFSVPFGKVNKLSGHCLSVAQVTCVPSFFSMQKDGDEQSSGKVDAAIATAMGLGAENETN